MTRVLGCADTVSSVWAWPGEHIPRHTQSRFTGLRLCVSRSLWGNFRLLNQTRQEGPGRPCCHAAVLTWAGVVACTLAVGETKTLENHSGADLRTEHQLLVFQFNLARTLLVTRVKYGSVKEHTYLKTNTSYSWIIKGSLF